MRLFLASYRFGGHEQRFVDLIGTPGPIAVIANAVDSWSAPARASALSSDVAPLQTLGFEPIEVDLRDYIDRPDAVRETLARFPAVWVRGGNTFVLRAQLARSGADRALTDLVRSDSLVYTGYSAGACAMTPSLRGIEAADDPNEVRPTCGIDPVWDGLGLYDRAIVPHWQSETDVDDANPGIVARFQADGTPHQVLTDDQVIVVDGDVTELL